MSKKKHPTTSKQVNGLWSDEEQDICKEVASLLAEPERWMDAPNDQLGGQKPAALIGTEQEEQLRDLLRAIKYGMMT